MSGEFLTGLILGVLVGLVLGPILRFWIAWHEWVDASKEARLTEEVMKRMGEGPWGRSDDVSRASRRSPGEASEER